MIDCRTLGDIFAAVDQSLLVCYEDDCGGKLMSGFFDDTVKCILCDVAEECDTLDGLIDCVDCTSDTDINNDCDICEDSCEDIDPSSNCDATLLYDETNSEWDCIQCLPDQTCDDTSENFTCNSCYLSGDNISGDTCIMCIEECFGTSITDFPNSSSGLCNETDDNGLLYMGTDERLDCYYCGDGSSGDNDQPTSCLPVAGFFGCVDCNAGANSSHNTCAVINC